MAIEAPSSNPFPDSNPYPTRRGKFPSMPLQTPIGFTHIFAIRCDLLKGDTHSIRPVVLKMHLSSWNRHCRCSDAGNCTNTLPEHVSPFAAQVNVEAIRKVKRAKELAIVGASSPFGEPELQVLTWRVHFCIVFALVLLNQDARKTKVGGVARKRIKEAENIICSLSQLRNLINI